MNYASMERQRLWLVLATIVINVAVSSLTLAPWSDWRAALALNAVDDCLLVGFVFASRDALLARFIVFGLAPDSSSWQQEFARSIRQSWARKE